MQDNIDQVFLIDTNVLLFDPQALGHFPGACLCVPLEVIEDLDHFKHGADETARNARMAAQAFDALRKKRQPARWRPP